MMHLTAATICGLLGNVISFMVFLAPMKTFYGIFKKKSTQGFQALPYSVALFSCTLLLYYGWLKITMGGFMIITINAIGLAIEAIYLGIYMFYAPTSIRKSTTQLLLGFNLGVYGAIAVATYFIFKGPLRVQVVGWVCAIFSVLVFAAPLSVMKLVIKTKSVEFMPFNLSACLTLCAVIWFFYGMLIHDYFIALPNVLGFAFGIAQMVLYGYYRGSSKKINPDEKASERSSTDIELANCKDNSVTEEEPKKPDADASPAKNSCPEHVLTVVDDSDEEIVEVIEEVDERANKNNGRPLVAEPERIVDFHQPIAIMVGV